jgi:hypothetical protein
MRARNALLARAGTARTFGGLGSFLAVIFHGAGIYLLQESFTDPLQAQAVNRWGVYHRSGCHPDLFYFYSAQALSSSAHRRPPASPFCGAGGFTLAATARARQSLARTIANR